MKRAFVFSVLSFLVFCAFGLEKVNVGSYVVGNITVECYDDLSLRICDLKKVVIILGCADVDTAVKASAKIKEIIESNGIESVEQMLKFFEKVNVGYKYEQYNNDSDYFITAQVFLEEHLVPKYGIKSGKTNIQQDYTIECKRWSVDSKQYEYEMHKSNDKSKGDNYIIEFKNWNKSSKIYESKVYTYSDHVAEYKDWNENKQCYDYCLDTYSDHTVEWKNWNNDKDGYESKVYKYSDYTAEYKDWNKNKQFYDYCLDTYSNLTVEWKNWNNNNEGYESKVYKYADHTEKYGNWNKDKQRYDYRLTTFSDHTIECRNWNAFAGNWGSYEYVLYTYPDRTCELNFNGYEFDSDIRDKNGKIIAYAHSSFKKGKLNVEVFSGGIIYQYFDVTKSEDGKTFSFKSLNKIENGKVAKLKGGSLYYKDFYKDTESFYNPNPWGDVDWE